MPSRKPRWATRQRDAPDHGAPERPAELPGRVVDGAEVLLSVHGEERRETPERALQHIARDA